MKNLLAIFGRSVALTVVVGAMAVACGGEDGSWSAKTMNVGADQNHAEQNHARKGNVNTREVLLMSLGASTSAGYTFDPTLLGIEAPPVYANNHHIDPLAALVAGETGSEVDVYNLAVPGSTTTDVLNEQLPSALEEIGRYRRGAVVTVEGGGNDLRAFQVAYIEYCLNPDPAAQYVCGTQLTATLTQVENNLRTIIAALQDAAPDATIILQTQYNSFYGVLPNGAPCVDPPLLAIADAALEGNPEDNGAPFLGLNPRIRTIAAEYGVKVADISGMLRIMPGEQYKDPSYFSNDCTHLAGTRGSVAYLGMPADEVGAGYKLLLDTFAFALAN
ncbi:MAG: SGNH/GDSL hydrolase family protein [Deltaproteobacteria bacterium]|nr:SGNH/GDSL hydrolase family protein [Deltaproteobacteria bacterium]